VPIHDRVAQPVLRQRRRYWHCDGDRHPGVSMDCQEQCHLDHDYVADQWRRKRLSRLPCHAEFPSSENRNADDSRSSVHGDAISGGSADANADPNPDTKPNTDPNANANADPDANPAPAPDPRAANPSATVHLHGQLATSVVPVWRGHGSISIGLLSKWLPLDRPKQCVMDHDYVRRKQ
jgi:hypothetical protein